jgi:hypothetical protein
LPSHKRGQRLKDLQSAFTLKRPVDYSKQQAAVEEIEEDEDDDGEFGTNDSCEVVWASQPVLPFEK